MRQQRRMKRTCAAWIVASVSALIAYPHIAFTGFCRLEDVQKLIDCSNVQAYTINSAKVVFIKKRPQNRQFKGAGNYCTSCDRSLQDPFIHCSLNCKVDFVVKHYKDLTPFLRTCNTLTLSPDFLIPQDMGEDEMTNETPHSTVVDSNEPQSLSSGFTKSE
ncbi:hypothetical protein GOBAR_AA08061 [Gossypium barbadense]|uniref:Uncharacterized protein n=1 Tax=Gossypium barbadense TaxID=3634 RepID=A0A2P5YAL2_GOSBA|nr:hypothetical protein GOBAR_AA08061 [Gossypium barbadense]